MIPIPPGFTLHTRSSAVTKPWEPIYANQTEGSFQLGLTVTPAHCNSRGMLHGGVIATLADNAMGRTLFHTRNDGLSIVTTSLSLDYFGLAQVDQWLQIVPRLVSTAKRSGVVDAIIYAHAAAIARANATFRVIG